MSSRPPAVHALVPAAGRGTRFGGSTAKQFLPLAGRPLLAWTLDAILRCEVASVTVALPADQLARDAGLADDPRVRWVAGGSSRQESVALALAGSPAGPDDLVLVHDGARPAVAREDLAAVVAAAARHGGAVLGRPVADTLKRLEGSVIAGTVERDRLFRAETPQVFVRRRLEEALARAVEDGVEGTDEAALVERLGGEPIAAVEAAHPNPKITRAGDELWVASLLEASGAARKRPERSEMLRIGQGYDVHRLAGGRRLVLGGEEIPFDRGLDGFSDADVLLHALGDALLGAAGLGDLGEHFPPGDERWRDASSVELLRRIVELVAAVGWRPVNCDLTLVAEAPKLAPHRDAIRRRIAGVLGIAPGAVGLKATTNERIGFVGREEGMAALAVVLVASTEESEESGS